MVGCCKKWGSWRVSDGMGCWILLNPQQHLHGCFHCLVKTLDSSAKNLADCGQDSIFLCSLRKLWRDDLHLFAFLHLCWPWGVCDSPSSSSEILGWPIISASVADSSSNDGLAENNDELKIMDTCHKLWFICSSGSNP